LFIPALISSILSKPSEVKCSLFNIRFATHLKSIKSKLFNPYIEYFSKKGMTIFIISASASAAAERGQEVKLVI